MWFDLLMRRALAFSLSLSLILVSAGLAPYRALAADVGAAPGAAWTPVIAATLPALQAAGSPQTLALEQTLGELRFDLALKREDAAALLADALPGPYRGHPEALVRLSPEAGAGALQAAVETARERLDREANELASAASNGSLTTAQAERLRLLASAYYLLSAPVAARTRALAGSLAQAKARSLLDRLASALSGRPAETTPQAALHAELTGIFAGAQALAQKLPADAPRGSFAQSTLAPYAKSALSQAADRLSARGFSPDALHGSILVNHQQVFARLAPQGLVEPLRRSGDWTPFVATLSAAAATEIGESWKPLVAPLSSHPAFRMAIPAWSPFAGPATVADLIAARFGPAADVPVSKPRLHLFTLFGIPVGSDPFSLLIIGSLCYSLSGNLISGAILATMIYGSVLLHELGHALTARRYGISTLSITLNPLGGMAALSREPYGAAEEFWITLNGPMVNVALAGLGALAQLLLPAAALPLAHYFTFLNATLAFFNLVIPAFPMDSARILRSSLTLLLRGDDYKAGRITAGIGRIAAPGMILFGLASGYVMMIFIGLYLSMNDTASMALRPGTELVPSKK